jgi:hypothetical protein
MTGRWIHEKVWSIRVRSRNALFGVPEMLVEKL